jgi:hypothetical protein
MDLIISKAGTDGHEILRRVQVEGKYLEADKTDKGLSSSGW